MLKTQITQLQQDASQGESQEATISILDSAVLEPLIRGTPPGTVRALALTCRAAAAAARHALVHLSATEAGAEAVEHTAAKFPLLASLRLRLQGGLYGPCPPDVAGALQRSLPRMTGLRELTFKHCSFRFCHEQALASALPALTQLERFTVDHCHVTGMAFAILPRRCHGCRACRPSDSPRRVSAWRVPGLSHPRWRLWGR